MSHAVNRRLVLAHRPMGEPQEADFRMEQEAMPTPGPGQVLLRTIWLSLDPYMRGRMSDAPSYVPPVAIGAVMTGGAISEVVASHAEGLQSGDLVQGLTGWQSYAAVDAKQVRKLERGTLPASTALGVLGMPGMTAYCGLLNIGQPKPGETVVVAAASGPVGSMVGQIAKLRGARAVGIAGGEQKCAYVRSLGFEDCIDHRAPDLPERLAQACPKGIDVYFENVGGKVWDAVFPLLNTFARIPVCGLISHYNQTAPSTGPDRSVGLMRAVLSKRLTIRGFIVTDFASQEAEFLREVGAWVAAGEVKYREDIVEGLEHAPAAFIGMLNGKNFGKLVVRVGPDNLS
jgi:NADPH-dependent curcumin reductase CurA